MNYPELVKVDNTGRDVRELNVVDVNKVKSMEKQQTPSPIANGLPLGWNSHIASHFRCASTQRE